MSKNFIPAAVKVITQTAKKHAPEILTGVGISGIFVTGVMTVKATIKAVKIVEKKKEETGGKLTKKEIIQTTWKLYIPPFTIAVCSAGSLLGANHIHLRRNAALAAAYQISETAFKEYREKAVETLGEKKEKEIRDAVDKQHIDQNPVMEKEIVITDKGNVLCYESLSGRYFMSNRDFIERTINEFNRRLISETFMSLNEFYDLLELSNTDIGDMVYWNISDGGMRPSFSSQLAADGRPCLVLGYINPPNYKKY